MAYSTPLFSVSWNTGTGSATDPIYITAAADSTGCDLIVICATWYAAAGTPTLSDSKGNTYTALTAHTDTVPGSLIAYCQAPTVGSGHTFTLNLTGSFPRLSAMGFSGSAASPFDQQNGSASSGATSLATGSVTPTQNDELVIAALTRRDGGTLSIGDGFTIEKQEDWEASHIGHACAYKIQTTSAAVNPTWSWSGSVYCASSIATFKAAGGSGSPDVTLNLSGQSVTSTGGAFGLQSGLSLLGQQATVSAGTLAYVISKALSGDSVTSSTGTLTQSHSHTISGQAATISAGTLEHSRSLSLTGVEITVLAGTIGYNVGGDLTLALSGQQVSVAIGNILGANSLGISGQSVTTSAGTFTLARTIVLDGEEVASLLGTITGDGVPTGVTIYYWQRTA
jgi:hypothetical protein